MTKTKPPAPPRGLHKTAREFWTRAVTNFRFNDEERAVLESACRLLTRAEEAAAQIAREGATIAARHGPMMNPAVRVEASARNAFLTHIRALRLIDAPGHGGKR